MIVTPPDSVRDAVPIAEAAPSREVDRGWIRVWLGGAAGPVLLLGAVTLLGLTVLGVTNSLGNGNDWLSAVALVGTATAIASAWARRREQINWVGPASLLAARLRETAQAGNGAHVAATDRDELDVSFGFEELLAAVAEYEHASSKRLKKAIARAMRPSKLSLRSQSQADLMTHSGLYASPPPDRTDPDASLFGTVQSHEMINRLEPRRLRWLESSPAEQAFVGWKLSELRRKSFLDIVHAEDRERVRLALEEALERGEKHGLVTRLSTAEGKTKVVEMNVGIRYASDRSVLHLRCHLTDVTDKIRAERELKIRTRELLQVNEQLRLINRELEHLKDRYTDLYQNAPAMYFSLNDLGRFIELNDTFLRTLGRDRDELMGASYEVILPAWRRESFRERFAEYQRTGSVDVVTQWVKADGGLIDVLLTGTAILGRDGGLRRSRIVAQDITARQRLEAELQEKNRSLARANDELSLKNREMDEFTYVVSHDLQEPLRTLIAFSDFLLNDCADQLNDSGREYVRYIVDASRRMRSLIQGLLTLSRAGRVTGDFAAVNLNELVAQVRDDLGQLTRDRRGEIRVPEMLPTVWGDRDRLAQLIANLVVNGLKYNRDPNPWVEINADGGDAEGAIRLRVRDNGIGIEPRFHSKIFQLFRRLHGLEEFEGTGAGLAICQKIVHAHNGRIWVESAPGAGSTFHVELPKRGEGGSEPAEAETE